MPPDNHFSVISTGTLLEGFDVVDVEQQLISVAGMKPEHARVFFDRPRVLKQSLTQEQATSFCARMATLGIATTIQATPAEPDAEL